MNENRQATIGDVCMNSECSDYWISQSEKEIPNIMKHGRTKQGRQRYRCKTCGKTFTNTKGTFEYRKRTNVNIILNVLFEIADGERQSAIERKEGHKAETVSKWLSDASYFYSLGGPLDSLSAEEMASIRKYMEDKRVRNNHLDKDLWK